MDSFEEYDDFEYTDRPIYASEIDGFKTACLDNIRALSQKQTVFVYRNEVLEKTKELCQKKGIEIKINKEEDYYIIRNVEAKKKDKLY